jgi:hypothetical protein
MSIAHETRIAELERRVVALSQKVGSTDWVAEVNNTMLDLLNRVRELEQTAQRKPAAKPKDASCR